MFRTISMSLALFILLSLLCTSVSAQPAPNAPPEFDIPKDPRITVLFWRVENAKRDLDFIDLAENQLGQVKKIEKLVREGSVAGQKEAEELLEQHQALAGLLRNKPYAQEMLPLLIRQIKGQGPPKEPTILQQKLLKAARGNTDKLVSEIVGEIRSQRTTLVKELKKAAEELHALVDSH